MTTLQPSHTNGSHPEFAIQRLYVKDVSFESPLVPEIYDHSLQPMINLNIQTTSTKLTDGLFEVVLATTVTATANEKTVFLAEVKQAGTFTIKNIAEQNMGAILSVTCPTILFPYVREAISELVARGGFQHFYLAPINFEALYLDGLKKQQQETTKTEETH